MDGEKSEFIRYLTHIGLAHSAFLVFCKLTLNSQLFIFFRSVAFLQGWPVQKLIDTPGACMFEKFK